MSFSPCPKPQPAAPKPRKWLPRATKPISRAWLKRGTKKIPQMNRRAVERRAKKYRTVIASPFNKLLRYRAYQRSGGFCECEMCHDIRSLTMSRAAVGADAGEIERAHTEIPCWFTRKGSEPHLRFRSKDGELHHKSYRFFSEENPEELKHVLWIWKSCHARIESQHNTRRRYLRGK